MAAVLPTGDQYEIASGPYHAVVTEVGATLRDLTVEGREVVRGFAADARPRRGSGQQLVPWPNRIRDGRYEFEGKTYQLALTEPARSNASHGLARHVPWRLVTQTATSVTLAVRVYPQLGWPGTLEASLTYSVGAEGLRVEVRAENLGRGAFPFGYGAHPYLTVGEPRVDEVSLTVPANSYLEVDDRLLPVALKPVDGTPTDRRRGEPLGSVTLDTAFTDLKRDTDGRWRVRLERGDRVAELWGDQRFGWLQVYTGDDDRDISIAVEPMTCGPDAFNAGPTHEGVLVLQPSDSVTGVWGIWGR